MKCYFQWEVIRMLDLSEGFLNGCVEEIRKSNGIKDVVKIGKRIVCRDFRGRLYEVRFNPLGGGDVIPMLVRIKGEVVEDEC
jgi:hypothetical protein